MRERVAPLTVAGTLRGSRPPRDGLRRAKLAFAHATVLALLFAANPAAAEPPGSAAEAKARQHFKQGQEHFDAGRFAEAAHEYEAGYELSRRPQFLLNVAHAYRRMGDLDSASVYYKKFLFVDPKSPKRAEVEATLKQLEELKASSQPARAAAPPATPPAAAAPSTTPPPPDSAPGTTVPPSAAVPPPEPARAPPLGPADGKGSRAIDVHSESKSAGDGNGGTPFYGRAWFWSAVGAAVLAGAATVYFYGYRSGSDAPEPTLGTVRR
jgi:tetratricopeptide (TPR) repeat protein